mgnify:CR=1 FL=1
MEWYAENKHVIANTFGSFLLNILMGLVLMGICMFLVCFSVTLKNIILQDQKKILLEKKQKTEMQNQKDKLCKNM